jgi:hypothetical protein
MCGFVGLIDQCQGDEMSGILERMSSWLGHRDPDDSGTWLYVANGCSLRSQAVSALFQGRLKCFALPFCRSGCLFLTSLAERCCDKDPAILLFRISEMAI